VQPSCQNAEVVEAFCRAAASRSNTRRSIQQPRPLLHFTRPAEMPPLHSLRFALASRLPSRTAPTLNPHSARCLAGAQLPAISCLGAFRPPALGVRGETVIPAAENLHRSRIRRSTRIGIALTLIRRLSNWHSGYFATASTRRKRQKMRVARNGPFPRQVCRVVRRCRRWR